MAGAMLIWRVTGAVAEMPSPLAVMVSGAVATVTVEEAVRVRVEVAAPLAPVGVT